MIDVVQRIIAKAMAPSEGQLFIVSDKQLYTTTDSGDVTEVPEDSIVMFIEELTYGKALEQKGHTWEKLEEETRHGPKDEIFWSMLYKENVIFLPKANIEEFIKPVTMKKKSHWKALLSPKKE